MSFLDQIKNSYFYKLKEILGPTFRGEAEIIKSDDPTYIAKLKHDFGEVPIRMQGPSKLKFDKFGSFETWEDGKVLAQQILEQLIAFKEMSIANKPRIEEKWRRLNESLLNIWRWPPTEKLSYMSKQDPGSTAYKAEDDKGNSIKFVCELTETPSTSKIEVKVNVTPASGWGEIGEFKGTSRTRHTRRLDWLTTFLNSKEEAVDFDNVGYLFSMRGEGSQILLAYALGKGRKQTEPLIDKVLTPRQSPNYPRTYHLRLDKLDPEDNKKIYTDYGIAGYVLQPQGQAFRLIVQLFDMPFKYEEAIPAGEDLDQSALLRRINAAFEAQFLRFRSRDPWNVDPQKGKFEDFDRRLASVFSINETVSKLKLAEGIGDDINEYVKSILKKALSSPEFDVGGDPIEVESGKKLPKHHILVKLKKPGSSFWIILQHGSIYAKPGGFAGDNVFIDSDETLKHQILKWYKAPLSKKRVQKRTFGGGVTTAPQHQQERFPKQKKYKDIGQSQYFPRAVYHREGDVPGAKAVSQGDKTPFMLSIHAAESAIDFPGSGEKGKFPAGLFTGLDLHGVSASGVRPGHLGWIGGYYSGGVMYITEAQSDLMQRTWDLLDRTSRDVDTSVGSGKKKQIVRSQKHRIRELASQLKQARVELANMQQREYGNVSEKYRLLERIHDLSEQLNAAKNRYKKFTRLPMFSDYKSQLENMYRTWIRAFYTDAFNFARDKGLEEVRIITTDQIQSMHMHVNLGKNRESSIYHRLYDKIAMDLGAEKSADGKWWVKPIADIPVKESIDVRVNRLINEAIYGNKTTVFHKTPNPEKILSIAKWGFFPSLRGAHGQGLYAVFDPDKMKSSWLQTSSYGGYVIKLAVNLSNKILILDHDVAKKFYGDNFRISDQLDQMGVNWRRQDMSEFDQWELHKKVDYTDAEATVQKIDEILSKPSGPSHQHGQVARLISYSSLRYDVNGIFFVGPHGHEIVGFDTSIFKPIGFSRIDRGVNSINDLIWHKFDKEGIDFIYAQAADKGTHVLPPKSHWYRQL